MVESTPPAVLSPDELEAFTVLVLRYMDGDCTAQEILHLKAAIAESAAYRALFVQVCRMQGNLYEAYVTRRTEYQHKMANATVPATATNPGDSALPTGSPVEVPPGDQGTDTIVRELSAEDTNHVTKTPKQ
jgi:hypothetical protein